MTTIGRLEAAVCYGDERPKLPHLVQGIDITDARRLLAAVTAGEAMEAAAATLQVYESAFNHGADITAAQYISRVFELETSLNDDKIAFRAALAALRETT